MAKVGRPTVMTESTLGKLEQAFAIDATIEEACFFADINPDTYYVYVKVHPEFSDRVKALRQRPVLLARQSVVEGLTDNPDLALKYLERKAKAEFSPRAEIEHSVDDPVKILLEKFGITEAIADDRQDAGTASGSSEVSS